MENEMLNILKDMQRDITGLKDGMAGMQQDISGLKDGLTGMQNEIKGIHEEINGIHRETNVLYGEMSGINVELKAIKSDLHEQKQELSSFKQQTNTRFDKIDLQLDRMENENQHAILSMLKIQAEKHEKRDQEFDYPLHKHIELDKDFRIFKRQSQS
ncbi:hypothetical protein [Jeotgalibacillus terrae]|uniref:t-SNARE coiled-coil homology domain-containing protein n=1 Tax=Jeotgalibacillus terrae TaxID=587735 RepID=A0ABW5ZGV1_9BACL|nr:hypothetical protein [Jeotgalibacillus terrae]MBM7579125.1 septal ring factor EnvC (AmiA/AmiB activator) [Jeotgalibacillus terrae]